MLNKPILPDMRERMNEFWQESENASTKFRQHFKVGLNASSERIGKKLGDCDGTLACASVIKHRLKTILPMIFEIKPSKLVDSTQSAHSNFLVEGSIDSSQLEEDVPT